MIQACYHDVQSQKKKILTHGGDDLRTGILPLVIRTGMKILPEALLLAHLDIHKGDDKAMTIIRALCAMTR